MACLWVAILSERSKGIVRICWLLENLKKVWGVPVLNPWFAPFCRAFVKLHAPKTATHFNSIAMGVGSRSIPTVVRQG